jgi:pimeloyl-ACP methyl ester carboxylesterase
MDGLAIGIRSRIGVATNSAGGGDQQHVVRQSECRDGVRLHGIFSNSNDCWRSPRGVFWPDLVKSDARLGNPGIYLGGYDTSFSSGLFRVYDAADQLLLYLKTPPPDGKPAVLARKKVIFVAHSLGGVVVRQMLVTHPELFQDKSIGLLLIASPSRGSLWADRLEPLAESFGNKMAMDLKRNNSFLDSLDRQFAEMVARKDKLPNLVGMDIFETKFIVRTFFGTSAQVVSANDTAPYFGAYKVVPEADHFSIVKPESTRDVVHNYLVSFYLEAFEPLTRKVASAISPADWEVAPSATGRKLFHANIKVFDADTDQAKFNTVWALSVTNRINALLSSVLPNAPAELQFEGVAILPSVDAADLERLEHAGRDLNGAAIAATTVETRAAAAGYLTESTFRAMFKPLGGQPLSFAPISSRVPSGSSLGPITAQRAMSKQWGYYMMLALASRCLDAGSKTDCDRAKLATMLEDARRTLGPKDAQLASTFVQLTRLAQRAAQ